MKTIKQVEVTPRFSQFIPPMNEMEFGILYISPEYETANHLCLCGCGNQSVTPIGKGGWRLDVINTRVTLSPSILNNNCPNKSHYIITKNKANFV